MREPWTELYLHLVWATWDRLPLIKAPLVQPVYACIQEECRKLKCESIAIGGIEDHVHLLARVHPTVCASDLVKQVKGSSSHLVTHRLPSGEPFKWQGAYGAFSVSKSDVLTIRRYILNQEQHHRLGTANEIFERMVFDGTGHQPGTLPAPAE